MKLSGFSSHAFFFLSHYTITNVTAAQLNGLPFSQLQWRLSPRSVPHEYLRVAILCLAPQKPATKLSPGLEYFTLFLCNRTRCIDIITLKPVSGHE
jgi:hypothetical protein